MLGPLQTQYEAGVEFLRVLTGVDGQSIDAYLAKLSELDQSNSKTSLEEVITLMQPHTTPSFPHYIFQFGFNDYEIFIALGPMHHQDGAIYLSAYIIDGSETAKNPQDRVHSTQVLYITHPETETVSYVGEEPEESTRSELSISQIRIMREFKKYLSDSEYPIETRAQEVLDKWIETGNPLYRLMFDHFSKLAYVVNTRTNSNAIDIGPAYIRFAEIAAQQSPA